MAQEQKSLWFRNKVSGVTGAESVFTPGGDSTYERGGDARRKFWIKPLKATDLGVAQAFFDPWKRPCWGKWENLDYMNGVNKTN